MGTFTLFTMAAALAVAAWYRLYGRRRDRTFILLLIITLGLIGFVSAHGGGL